jgi:hypothetical protein
MVLPGSVNWFVQIDLIDFAWATSSPSALAEPSGWRWRERERDLQLTSINPIYKKYEGALGRSRGLRVTSCCSNSLVDDYYK